MQSFPQIACLSACLSFVYSDMLGKNQVCKKEFSLLCVVQLLLVCWQGKSCLCIRLISGCFLFAVLPFSFPCVKIRLAFSLISRELIMPFFGIMLTSFKWVTSFKWISVGMLWLWAGLSSIGVNFTLKSKLIPMSNLCFARMYWNSTGKSSVAWRNCLSNVEPIQSKKDNNWSRNFWLPCGFSYWHPFKLSALEVCVSVMVCVGFHHMVSEVWETTRFH